MNKIKRFIATLSLLALGTLGYMLLFWVFASALLGQIPPPLPPEAMQGFWVAVAIWSVADFTLALVLAYVDYKWKVPTLLLSGATAPVVLVVFLVVVLAELVRDLVKHLVNKEKIK